MRIAVCEDNDLHRDIIACLIRRYADERALNFDLVTYKNGTSFIYDVEEGAYFDAVFLDIYMDDILGIDVARKLRADSYGGSIVFLTASPDFAIESYDVDADGYLLKPLVYAKLENVLNSLTREVKPNTYRVVQRSAVTSLAFNEIMYIESQNSKCIIHTASGKNYTAYKTLTAIEKELGDARFYRSHQSFLVNLDYVKQVDKDFLIQNGEVIPIRQRGTKPAREAFIEYTEQKNRVIEYENAM